MLAGGEITAVTQDAFEEHALHLPADTVNLGSLKEPSMELILQLKPDLLILMPTLQKHLNMAETLDRTGISYAYFEMESFGDYLSVLKTFTDITGREDLYLQNGAALQPQIAAAVDACSCAGKKVLLLRTSSVKIKALDSATMVGSMLAEFGCENIADSNSVLLNELSLEAIVQANPDYIFIVCMGDEAEAVAQLESSYASNPVWQKLDAVKNGRCHYLPKELFHYKPNARWGESYEMLASLLEQN